MKYYVAISLSGQNNHWNPNLSKNRPACVFIASLSITDVVILGWFDISDKE